MGASCSADVDPLKWTELGSVPDANPPRPSNAPSSNSEASPASSPLASGVSGSPRTNLKAWRVGVCGSVVNCDAVRLVAAKGGGARVLEVDERCVYIVLVLTEQVRAPRAAGGQGSARASPLSLGLGGSGGTGAASSGTGVAGCHAQWNGVNALVEGCFTPRGLNAGFEIPAQFHEAGRRVSGSASPATPSGSTSPASTGCPAHAMCGPTGNDGIPRPGSECGGGHGSGNGSPTTGHAHAHPGDNAPGCAAAVYVLSGNSAPGGVKSFALLRGVHLQMLLLNTPGLSNALLSVSEVASLTGTQFVSAAAQREQQHQQPQLPSGAPTGAAPPRPTLTGGLGGSSSSLSSPPLGVRNQRQRHSLYDLPATAATGNFGDSPRAKHVRLMSLNPPGPAAAAAANEATAAGGAPQPPAGGQFRLLPPAKALAWASAEEASPAVPQAPRPVSQLMRSLGMPAQAAAGGVGRLPAMARPGSGGGGSTSPAGLKAASPRPGQGMPLPDRGQGDTDDESLSGGFEAHGSLSCSLKSPTWGSRTRTLSTSLRREPSAGVLGGQHRSSSGLAAVVGGVPSTGGEGSASPTPLGLIAKPLSGFGCRIHRSARPAPLESVGLELRRGGGGGGAPRDDVSVGASFGGGGGGGRGASPAPFNRPICRRLSGALTPPARGEPVPESVSSEPLDAVGLSAPPGLRIASSHIARSRSVDPDGRRLSDSGRSAMHTASGVFNLDIAVRSLSDPTRGVGTLAVAPADAPLAPLRITVEPRAASGVDKPSPYGFPSMHSEESLSPAEDRLEDCAAAERAAQFTAAVAGGYAQKASSPARRLGSLSACGIPLKSPVRRVASRSVYEACTLSDDDSPVDEKTMEEKARNKLNYWAPLCSDVYPFLCVSGHVPAEHLGKLIMAGVSHVVNTVRMIVGSPYPDHMTYFDFNMMDTPNEDLSLQFPHIVGIIEEVRAHGGKVLVHCQQGSSRSCTLILAYMMWAHGMKFRDALEELRTKRGVAKPNMGFSARLLQWEKQLQLQKGSEASPPFAMAVYTLSCFSVNSPENLVLGLDRFLSTPQAPGTPQRPSRVFDSRTIYVILDHRCRSSAAATGSPPAPLIWVGRRAPSDKFLPRVTGDLLRDVLLYGHKQGSRAVVAPEIVRETDAPPPARVVDAWAHLGIDGAGIDDSMDHALMHAHGQARAWTWDAVAEAQRKSNRDRDLLALKEGKGGIGKATPRLRSEMTEAVDMFVREGPHQFTPHPTYAAAAFDDDEFDDFRDAYFSATCVFVKHKADLRLVDIWLGEDAADDVSTSLDTVVDEFKAWASTSAAPTWTGAIDWAAVTPTLTRDGGDGDDEIRFYSRWIRH